METVAPARASLRDMLSKRLGRIVGDDEAREAAENLLGLFRLLAKWDRETRESPEKFKNAGVRGVAGVPADAYPPAATGPGRAAR